MMPTGGINLNNMQSFLELGVDGFGIGSPLFNKSLVDAKDWNGLETHFGDFVRMIDKFRNSKK